MGLKVVEEVKIGEPAKKGDCEDRNTKHVTDSDDDDDDEVGSDNEDINELGESEDEEDSEMMTLMALRNLSFEIIYSIFGSNCSFT